VLATLLGAAASVYMLWDVHGSLGLVPAFEHFRLGLYLATSFFLVWIISELQSARMALLRSEEHFRRAQRSARIGAYEWNLGTGKVVWSQELPVLEGLSPERDFETWMLRVHEEDRDRLRTALRNAIQHGSDLNVDLRLSQPEGQICWVSLRGEIEPERDGQPCQALGVVIDITARKLTEQRLAAQHAVSLILANSVVLDEAVPRVLDAIGESLEWGIGTLWLHAPATGALRCEYIWQQPEAADQFTAVKQGLTLTAEAGIPGQVWSSGEPVWVQDVFSNPDFAPADAALKSSLSCAFAFPVRSATGPCGVIEFFTRDRRQPDPELLETVADLGRQIGQFIERSNAQAALRLSEERYRTLAETASDVIITISADGTVLFANRATESVFGYRPGELLGNRLTMLMPRDIRELYKQDGGNYLRTLRSGGTELIALHKSGREIQLEVSFSEFVAHGEHMFTGVARDITERKRLEETLRENERWLATTLNSIGDAVIATDGTGNVRLMNPLAETLTGFTLADASGLPLGQVLRLVDELGKQVEDPASRIARAGGNLGIVEQTNLARRNGDGIPIEITGTPRRDDKGRFAGAVLVFRDISSRKRAEETLRTSEKLAATGRLAATIAHEINNPMESVVNLLYLLANDSGLTEQQRKFVHMADQEISRITHIVQQTLGFYREASTPVPVSLTELLDSVVNLYTRVAEHRGITINRIYDFQGQVQAFPGEMRQVFSNLVANAIEALGSGGRIFLHVYPSMDWHSDQPGIRVVVADNGPGIAPQNRSQVFEPFFTTKGERGTGLGLWVSRGIVQKHGGRISMRSTVLNGRSGTAFSIYLPLSTARRSRMRSISETAA